MRATISIATIIAAGTTMILYLTLSTDAPGFHSSATPAVDDCEYLPETGLVILDAAAQRLLDNTATPPRLSVTNETIDPIIITMTRKNDNNNTTIKLHVAADTRLTASIPEGEYAYTIESGPVWCNRDKGFAHKPHKIQSFRDLLHISGNHLMIVDMQHDRTPSDLAVSIFPDTPETAQPHPHSRHLYAKGEAQ